MAESHAARETRLRELASRLLFTVSKEGARFSLFRDTDVSQPVRHDNLTLDEFEEIRLTPPSGLRNSASSSARHQILNLLNALCSKLATSPPCVGFNERRLVIAHSSASSDWFFVRCSQAEFVACKIRFGPVHICMLAVAPGRKLLI